jgi:hypothetical protein
MTQFPPFSKGVRRDLMSKISLEILLNPPLGKADKYRFFYEQQWANAVNPY